MIKQFEVDLGIKKQANISKHKSYRYNTNKQALTYNAKK